MIDLFLLSDTNSNQEKGVAGPLGTIHPSNQEKYRIQKPRVIRTVRGNSKWYVTRREWHKAILISYMKNPSTIANANENES